MTMQLDIVSDTICPWCYIGKKRLEKAMEMRPDLDLDIRWRPFQLDPTIPSEGVDRKTYLQRKFGSSSRAGKIYQSLKEAGAEDHIDFAFDKITKTPNTINSHRLIRWSGSAGCQDKVVDLLFQRYFEKGEDIGENAVLVSVAEEAGMDTAIVADLLESDADIDLVRQEDQLARGMEIAGVPCFVFDQKMMMPGAQDPEVIIGTIDRIRARRAQRAKEEANNT